MDGSNAKRNQDFGLSILKDALQAAGVAPKREFSSLQEFQKHFDDCDTLLIDGTEQRFEGPKNNEEQKQGFSGKKKLSSCPWGIPLKRRSFRQKTE